jgi:hypothetical protein
MDRRRSAKGRVVGFNPRIGRIAIEKRTVTTSFWISWPASMNSNTVM